MKSNVGGRSRLWWVLSTAGLALLVVAASPPPDSTVRTERVYFHCQGDTPLDNLGTAQGGRVQWDTTRPTGSMTDDGCVHVNALYDPHNNIGGGGEQFCVEDDPPVCDPRLFYAEGTFVGNVDSLTVTLYDVSNHARYTSGGQWMPLEVELVAGKFKYDRTLLVDTHTVYPGESRKIEFSFEGFHFSLNPWEKGAGTKVRDFKLAIRAPFGTVFGYDTDNYPSGITFNPGDLSGTVIHLR